MRRRRRRGRRGRGKEEEEASKCYFRNSFCPFMTMSVLSVFEEEEEVEDGEKED